MDGGGEAIPQLVFGEAPMVRINFPPVIILSLYNQF